jgi:hypothetical protein
MADKFIDDLPPGGGIQIGDKIPVTRGEGDQADDVYVTLAPEILTTAQSTDYLLMVRGSVVYRILVSDFLELINPPAPTPSPDVYGTPEGDVYGTPEGDMYGPLS